MSRRKQARPVRLLEEDGGVSPDPIPQTATPLDRENENSSSCSEDDISLSRNLTSEPHMCPRCHEQFTEMTEFVEHRVQCDNKARLHHELEHSDPEDMLVSGDEDEEECGGKRLEQVRRNRQDAANNNSVEEQDETCGEPSEEGQQPVGFPFPVPSAAAGHVTLEALQNTKVAVAQFAATAMANNVDNEAALQELAVLQSTLFTLQHQQVLQLQLINQLQHQLSLNRPKESNSTSPPVSETQTTPGSSIINPPPSSPPPPRIPIIIPSPREPTPPIINETPTSQSLPPTQISIPKTDPVIISQPPPPITIPPPTPPPLATQVPLCSISSAFAESIITNNDPPPSLDEPNTLEMLQRRAQEVLDNASQGLLANNLADELAFRKGKGSMSPYDSKSGRNEPFFKHRCRYCGKVFGSDSALQIHIRSHTGERPFKCNVCGSRFTTKGNLKVHFQRHTAKFPHIKMNPNPVPEHLDKYHPPLLAQLGQNQPVSPGLPPHQSHPLQFPNTHPFSLYRPPPGPHDLLPPRPLMSPQRPPDNQIRTLPPHPLFVRRGEQEVPENLSKPPRSPSPAPSPVQREILENRCKSEPIEDTPQDQPSRRNSESRSEDVDIAPKQEPDNEIENEHENPDNEIVPRFPSPTPYDDCSIDSKYSNDDMMGSDSPLGHDEQIQDQPENLSSKSSFAVNQLPMSAGQRIPASFPFSHAVSPPSSTSSGSLGTFPIPPPSSDPSKDPAVYTSLLPRPGSNDNSWESLIEVTKTSETSKLQQLVDNIEHKLTDPNQCVICHRVLSCKSALQMHYRTHTGERPFKCKICGRAFTTKGNLKTHMGVHRAKPPMRVLHQCPVCHKKFTNALVLQQHIRLHTGEPTDLTPEQIQAAEVKDFPSPGGFPLPNPMNPFLSQGFSIPGLSPLGPPGFPLNMKSDLEGMKDEHQEFMEEDEDDDDESSTTTEQHMPSFSTSLAALENQVRTITTVASQLSASHLSGLSQSNEDLCNSRTMTSTPTHQNGDKSPEMSIELSPNNSDVRCSPPQIPNMRPPSSQRATSPTPSESNSLGALDLTPRSSHLPEQNSTSPGPPSGPPLPPHPGVFSNFGLLPPTPTSGPLMTSALSSLTSSVLTSTAFSPLGLAVGPAVRGNTTCNLCFKTFACNSALEIHYRSHTKERPFKCTVCDRGFSTKGSIEGCLCSAGQGRIQDNKCQEKSKPKKVRKRTHDTKTSLLLSSASKIQNASTRLPLSLINPGYATASEWMRPFLLGNMKQHMLTHKIRDMPQHMFEKPPMTQPPTHLPPPPSLPPPSLPVKEDQRTTILPPEKSNNSNDQPDREREITSTSQPPVHLSLPEIPIKAEINIKRSPSETDLPVSKRPSSAVSSAGIQQSSKHLCHVCNKNFSSSSALQIHMRTHTGDKPFRCTVCQKAFTTKGNLKVHMGTHMWSNGASRRGRRMSLDLPPIPMTPKDSEFLQRRPDLFYPYLPAPFLNGMQQKLNEISVIQNPGNGIPSPGKYASLLGFGYPPVSEPMHSQPSSPLSEKHTSSIPNSPPRDGMERGSKDILPHVWDLHYERQTNAEEEVSPPNVGINVSPPSQLGVPQSARGEGLAA